jgi:tripartite-type tricarboxylate transporter receptor subunit TctC
MPLFSRSLWLVSVLFALLSPITSQAQGTPASALWPQRPVRIVVPWPAAGAIDILARAMAERLGQRWGQPVLVENRVGAASIIGADVVAKAPADGYTLMVTTEATVTSNLHLYKRLPYDPVRDLAPVTQLINLPQLLVVSSTPAGGGSPGGSPGASLTTATNLQQLVSEARARPLNYASWGAGSQPHLLFEALKAQTGVAITHVPYKGPADVVRAIGAGEVQMSLASAATWTGLIRAGRARALAVTRSERLPLLPEVPTLREAGFADIDPNAWMGLFATGGTPRELIQRLRAEVVTIFADAEFRERQLLARGLDPVLSTPEEFAAFIQRDIAFKARLIKLSGATAE